MTSLWGGQHDDLHPSEHCHLVGHPTGISYLFYYTEANKRPLSRARKKTWQVVTYKTNLSSAISEKLVYRADHVGMSYLLCYTEQPHPLPNYSPPGTQNPWQVETYKNHLGSAISEMQVYRADHAGLLTVNLLSSIRDLERLRNCVLNIQKIWAISLNQSEYSIFKWGIIKTLVFRHNGIIKSILMATFSCIERVCRQKDSTGFIKSFLNVLADMRWCTVDMVRSLIFFLLGGGLIFVVVVHLHDRNLA